MTASDVRPLPIWPHTVTPEQLELIKRAKIEIGVPYSVMPSPAAPGSPGRILALGEVPPFICETVLVAPENVERYESILGAMRFWLTAEAGAEGSIDEAAWLSGVMGCEVTLVDIENADVYLPNEEVESWMK